ncbi:translation initiation factor IF-2 [Candidatus Woesearchaeota archaeon]|nr:translation initiation factor IF-2 [Candidatus Woesearchaeota archaeon]
MLRQVIVTILGNVDSGKSSVIDVIKKTSIVKSEPGKITQSIKAYSVSLESIKTLCQDALDITKIKVPGLLLIDTPGHEAFSNLRKRGGSLADIAILVIDINEGLKPQTIESIEILKQNKTPFVVALNKIDLIGGWQSNPDLPLIKNIDSQNKSTKTLLDSRLYTIVGNLFNHGFNAERFDKISDFTKNLVLIPISAKTSEGLPELLMMITGLAQKFLELKLEHNIDAPGEGTILEISEEKGIGTCLDTIIYKGKLKTNDTIVVGTLSEPIVTKVKAIYIPEKNKLVTIKEAYASIGIKISAQNIKEAISGMPVKVANRDLEKIKISVKEEIEEITFELDHEGLVIKADSVGSLEALIKLLKNKKIKIKRASIGTITKKDIAEAESNNNELQKVILGFNTEPIVSDNIKIIIDPVIYSLIEKYESWFKETKENLEGKQLKNLIRPCKIRILPGYIFRQSNPAVVGVDILAGTLKSGTPLMKEVKITEAKSLQENGKNINEAEAGKSIALAMPNVTMNRQVKEGDILYSDVPEPHFKIYKKLKDTLKPEEIQVLKEIAEIKRKTNPAWGM